MTVYVQYIWNNDEDKGIGYQYEEDFTQNNSPWVRLGQIQGGYQNNMAQYVGQGSLNYNNNTAFDTVCIRFCENTVIPQITIKGVEIDLTQVGLTVGESFTEECEMYFFINNNTIAIELLDATFNYVDVIQNAEDYTIKIDIDSVAPVGFDKFIVSNTFIPTIETLWTDDMSTSIADSSNNYLVGHPWSADLSFKINTDNIKVDSYEQIYNTINMYVSYHEV